MSEMYNVSHSPRAMMDSAVSLDTIRDEEGGLSDCEPKPKSESKRPMDDRSSAAKHGW